MGVAVGFEVGEDFDAGIGVVDERAVLEPFGFEGADEGLGPGVVVGIGPGGHALLHAGLAQKLPVSSTAVLAATITVEDQVWERAARSQGLFESIGHQRRAQVAGQGPADDFAGAEIDDDGQIKPAAGGGDEGTEWNEIAKGRSLCPKGSAGGRWQMSPAQTWSGFGGSGWSRSRLGEGLSARPSLVLGT